MFLGFAGLFFIEQDLILINIFEVQGNKNLDFRNSSKNEGALALQERLPVIKCYCKLFA